MELNVNSRAFKQAFLADSLSISTVHWHEVVVYQRREWDTNKSHSSVDKRHMSVESHRTIATASA
jgi:hypothetical protein